MIYKIYYDEKDFVHLETELDVDLITYHLASIMLVLDEKYPSTHVDAETLGAIFSGTSAEEDVSRHVPDKNVFALDLNLHDLRESFCGEPFRELAEAFEKEDHMRKFKESILLAYSLSNVMQSLMEVYESVLNDEDEDNE